MSRGLQGEPLPCDRALFFYVFATGRASFFARKLIFSSLPDFRTQHALLLAFLVEISDARTLWAFRKQSFSYVHSLATIFTIELRKGWCKSQRMVQLGRRSAPRLCMLYFGTKPLTLGTSQCEIDQKHPANLVSENFYRS